MKDWEMLYLYKTDPCFSGSLAYTPRRSGTIPPCSDTHGYYYIHRCSSDTRPGLHMSARPDPGHIQRDRNMQIFPVSYDSGESRGW